MIGEQIKSSDNNIYVIDQEIDRGGFGIVYLSHNDEGAQFAIKVIGPIEEPELLESFEREINTSSVVAHKNLLGSLSHGRHTWKEKKYLFNVMEYCSDGNYRDVLKNRSGKVDVEIVVKEFIEILQGLEALHTKIIHRDLKPENILRTGNVLKVADLGLSRFVEEATRTLTFKGSGSPRYMAPETWERKRATPATDLYSIGVMLFEALTGQSPFSSDDLMQLRDLHLFNVPVRAKTLNNDIPAHIDGAIRKLLEKDPANRYQTVNQLISILKTPQSLTNDEGLNAIANKIRLNYDLEEKTRLEVEKVANEKRDTSAKDRYMEEKFIELIDEVVENINQQLQETEITKSNEGSGVIYQIGGRALYVNFFSQGSIYLGLRAQGFEEQLKKHHVVHGGSIIIAEGREAREGWNVVLTRSPEDIYGQWLLIETEMSALSGKSFRYNPSATTPPIFSENLAYHWMPAMHSYVLKDKPLTQEDLVGIFNKFIL